MAQDSLESYRKYDWDVELIEGYTSNTLEQSDIYDYFIMKGGRMEEFATYAHIPFLTKLSIIANQIRFWKMVIEKDEPIAFIEHDSICTRHYFHVPFEDILLLNLDKTSIKQQMRKLGREEHFNYELPHFPNPCNNLNNIIDWPWTYDYPTEYLGAKLPPGTSSYVLTPKGAKKLLNAFEKYGIEQGDMTINTFNVDIMYSLPKMSTYHINSTKLRSSKEGYHGKQYCKQIEND